MIFFKRFLNFVKNIFIKKDTIANSEKEEIIIIPEENTNNYDELFSQIKPGSIIWAKRYDTEEEKENIPEGHQEGPYIVLDKSGKRLVCIQGSSVAPQEEKQRFYFKLERNMYNLVKETYFNFNRFRMIDRDSFVKILSELDEANKNNLFTDLKINKKIYYFDSGNIKKIRMPLRSGDIVTYDDTIYLIMDICNDKCLCIPLDNLDIDKDLNFEDFKTLDYSKVLTLPLSKKLKYENYVSDNTVLYTLKKYKEYIENLQNKTNTQRGSIILKDEKYYYVYAEEGQDWLAFEINKNNIFKDCKLEIIGETFYTNFDDIKINKSDSYDTVNLCSEEEIDMIKDLRRNYKELLKKKKTVQPVKEVNLQIGDIIEDIKGSGEKYLIIRVYQDLYECLSFNKMKRNIYSSVSITKKNAKFSENNSMEEIKILDDQDLNKISKVWPQIYLDRIIKAQTKMLKKYSIRGNEFRIVQDDLKESILNTYESKKSTTKQNKNIIQRGCIIAKDEKYYYVYAEEGQDWLVFELAPNSFPNSQELKIGNKTVYTTFCDLKITKRDNYIIINFCSEKEIDKIKKLRRDYKEQLKKTVRIQPIREINFQIGDIIEDIGNANERYIIIRVYQDEYECISVSKMNRNIYGSTSIKKKNVKLSENNSTEEIKILSKKDLKKLAKTWPQIYLDRIVSAQEKMLKKYSMPKKEIEDSIIIEENETPKEIEDSIIIEENETPKEIDIVLDINDSEETNLMPYNNEDQEKNEYEYEDIEEENMQLKIGSIVRLKDNDNEKFVIVQLMGNLVNCINYLDIDLVGYKRNYLFTKENLVEIRLKDNSKNTLVKKLSNSTVQK